MWKDLIYNGKVIPNYKITKFGQVMSVGRIIINKLGYYQRIPERMMKWRTNHINPHYFIDARVGDKNVSVYVHKAVYETFIGLITKKYISFKNGNYSDVKPENLYQVTHSELQIRNMYNNPINRWKLSKINEKTGYYKNRGLNNFTKHKIREFHKKGVAFKEIATKLDVSLSSVYKYYY